MRIAIDAMGGDHAPREIVLGAIQAVNDLDIEVLLIGDQEQLEQELKEAQWSGTGIKIHHASQVVDMKESPAMVLRKKKDSSIVVATSLVKEGHADAVVSCGNTGAQMAAAIFILGRFEGIDRPALAAPIPRNQGQTVLLDVGANVDVKPEQLVQFALMGQAYAEVGLGINNPRIGLLNNGEEETKGNQATIAAHREMKDLPGLNFIGNIEGRELFSDQADVVVCDGFLGNTIIKSLEGFTFMMRERFLEHLGSETLKLFNDFDYTQVGGAPLLGVQGVSVVCHGSSKREAVLNGIRVAKTSVTGQLVSRLAGCLSPK